MYAAAINPPSPATRSPAAARRSRADGMIAAGWAFACQRGRDARHPPHPHQGRHRRQCRSGTGVQRDPNQASHAAKR